MKTALKLISLTLLVFSIGVTSNHAQSESEPIEESSPHPSSIGRNGRGVSSPIRADQDLDPENGFVVFDWVSSEGAKLDGGNSIARFARWIPTPKPEYMPRSPMRKSPRPSSHLSLRQRFLSKSRVANSSSRSCKSTKPSLAMPFAPCFRPRRNASSSMRRRISSGRIRWWRPSQPIPRSTLPATRSTISSARPRRCSLLLNPKSTHQNHHVY